MASITGRYVSRRLGVCQLGEKHMSIKQFIKRYIICVHCYEGGARAFFDRRGRKHHARVCVKCGKRKYLY